MGCKDFGPDSEYMKGNTGVSKRHTWKYRTRIEAGKTNSFDCLCDDGSYYTKFKDVGDRRKTSLCRSTGTTGGRS